MDGIVDNPESKISKNLNSAHCIKVARILLYLDRF